MSTLSYKFRSIEISDFKRIKNVQVDLSNSITIVGGKNKQGKSSVLDAIVSAVGGKSYAPSVPIRTGAERAEIILIVDTPQGPIKVKRTFTESGTKVEITNEQGFKSNRPQDALNAWLSKSSLDPLAFTRLKSKEQVEAVQKLLRVDFTKLDEKRKQAYDERTFVNRTVAELEAKFRNLPTVPDNTPDTEIDVVTLTAQVWEARDHNNEAKRLLIESDLHKEEAKRLALEIEELNKKFDAAVQKSKELSDQLDKHVPIDVSPLETALANAEETNRNVRQKKAVIAARKEWEEAKANSKALTETIEGCDAEKAKILSKVKFPVEGLGFSEDGLTLNGLPFEQASSAEQLSVSVPMAFAQNKALPFAIIRDGSLLDDESMKLVAELTVEAGAQLIIERVGTDDGEFTIVLEDGLEAGVQPELAVASN